MKLFVTGAAGFIGYHFTRGMLEDGHVVLGFDGLTPYYDPQLKRDRLAQLAGFDQFTFVEGMLEDAAALDAAYVASEADVVVHLAAQAGVRYSIESPQSYIQSNVVGTANLLESLRQRAPKHFMFGSTSSTYGGNEKVPFAETDRTDAPVSLYAATKKAGEAMVHSYAHLWNIPSTCLRFFSVYGPWGRPDMAAMKFAQLIRAGHAIEVYGNGRMQRDFTYVEDLVRAIVRLIDVVPRRGEPVAGDSLSAVAPYRVVNIGGGNATELMTFIDTLSDVLKAPASITMLPMQQGDMAATAADTTLLVELIGQGEATTLHDGLAAFAAWYDHYTALRSRAPGLS